MSEIDLHEAMRIRADAKEPVALIVGPHDNKHVAKVGTTLDMYDWRYGVFDNAQKYKDAVYTSMHTMLRNIDLIICVLTDAPSTSTAIDIGYILGIASTPAYQCPVMVYNTMELEDWPFLVHTIDATIDRLEDVAALMDILDMKRGIADFATRLRVALQILRSTR